MIDFPKKEKYTVEDLRDLVRILRAPDGCPWDSVQTHESIRRNFIEEVYEACEAIDLKDSVLLREELGDVLMQVIFHAGIEEDEGRFDLDDAADTACRKLLFRHPNLFTEGGSSLNWDELKKLEKGQQTTADAMDSVARSLPALWRAEKIQKKAAKSGFVWPDSISALDKLSEEVSELREAVQTHQGIEEELGDVLFAAVSAAMLEGLDPEVCLSATCEKFIRRFRLMETASAAKGAVFSQLDSDTMLRLWAAAKTNHITEGEQSHEQD